MQPGIGPADGRCTSAASSVSHRRSRHEERGRTPIVREPAASCGELAGGALPRLRRSGRSADSCLHAPSSRTRAEGDRLTVGGARRGSESPCGDPAVIMSFLPEPSGWAAKMCSRSSSPSFTNTISPIPGYAAGAWYSSQRRARLVSKASRRIANPAAVAASTANATRPGLDRDARRSRCERRRCNPSKTSVAVHRALGLVEPARQLVIDLRHRSSPRRRASPGRRPDAPAPARASSSPCLHRSRGPTRPRRCSSPAGTGGRPLLAAGGGASTAPSRPRGDPRSEVPGAA